MLLFIVAGVAIGSLYSLSAVGLLVLYRATGTLNLGYGGVGAVGALTAWQLNQRGVSLWASLGVCVAICAGVSVVWGRVLGPPLAARDPLVRAAATLGLTIVSLGICGYFWNDKARTLNLPTDQSTFNLGPAQVTMTQVIALVLVAVVAAAASILLRVTRLGTTMRALADDRELTAMLGARVRVAEAVAWAVCGLLGGVSAILFADLTVLSAQNLASLIIPALAAVLIGRLTSLWAAVAGGLILGILQSMVTSVTALSAYGVAVPFVAAVLVTLWFGRRLSYAMRGHA